MRKLIYLKYALLGDLHSSIADTRAVLQHIEQTAQDAKIIGLGDLYECTIGKKKALKVCELPLQKAAIVNEDFEKLLTFPSIRGNQEERITLVTGIKRFMNYPEIIHIDGAILMHGHQFQWSEKWKPIFPQVDEPLLFFGHSHESALYKNNKKIEIKYHKPISVFKKKYAINVRAVISTREWCLYDADQHTVTFMKVM